MNDFSQFVVFFLMLPVLMQIILPLVMLLGFGLGRAVGLLTGQQDATVGATNDLRTETDLQLSRI